MGVPRRWAGWTHRRLRQSGNPGDLGPGLGGLGPSDSTVGAGSSRARRAGGGHTSEGVDRAWRSAVMSTASAAGAAARLRARAMRRSLFSCHPDSKRSAESASIRSRRFTNQPASRAATTFPVASPGGRACPVRRAANAVAVCGAIRCCVPPSLRRQQQRPHQRRERTG
jgi:hypothetical protein